MTTARNFIAFWWKCCRIAAKGGAGFANDWQWLIGIPAVTGIGSYLAAQAGRSNLATGYPILDGLLTAFAAFLITWIFAFCVRLLNAPVSLQLSLQTEVEALKSLARGGLEVSFKIFVEAIPEQDADRHSIGGHDPLFRVGVTNLDLTETFEVYLVLEDVSPSLGISPAAKLPAMGKGIDARQFSIAPTETAYVSLLERNEPHRGFGEIESAEGSYVEFSVSSAHDDVMTRVMNKMVRGSIGHLKNGQTYTATIAVHGHGAISCRLPISVHLTNGGEISLETFTGLVAG